jgi:hypothetical protein
MKLIDLAMGLFVVSALLALIAASRVKPADVDDWRTEPGTKLVDYAFNVAGNVAMTVNNQADGGYAVEILDPSRVTVTYRDGGR